MGAWTGEKKTTACKFCKANGFFHAHGVTILKMPSSDLKLSNSQRAFT